MINFLKYRWLTAILSFVMLSTFIIAFAYKHYTRGHAFIYSVEFTGGTQILLRFAKPISGEKIAGLLEAAGWPGATTRDFSDTEILVRVKDFSDDPEGLAEKMRVKLGDLLPDNPATTIGSDSVGSGVGKSMQYKSVQAILAALLSMMLYVAFRFSGGRRDTFNFSKSIAFAAGTFVSLFHDALIVLLLYLLMDKEISAQVIGAILMGLAYSINDTIVIFARIRENLEKLKDSSVERIINISLNETLRRTILTTFATLLVVVSLFIFGGETLRSFAFSLLIGMVFGIYSTIFIASPVVLHLYQK